MHPLTKVEVIEQNFASLILLRTPGHTVANEHSVFEPAPMERAKGAARKAKLEDIEEIPSDSEEAGQLEDTSFEFKTDSSLDTISHLDSSLTDDADESTDQGSQDSKQNSGSSSTKKTVATTRSKSASKRVATSNLSTPPGTPRKRSPRTQNVSEKQAQDQPKQLRSSARKKILDKTAPPSQSKHSALKKSTEKSTDSRKKKTGIVDELVQGGSKTEAPNTRILRSSRKVDASGNVRRKPQGKESPQKSELHEDDPQDQTPLDFSNTSENKPQTSKGKLSDKKKTKPPTSSESTKITRPTSGRVTRSKAAVLSIKSKTKSKKPSSRKLYMTGVDETAEEAEIETSGIEEKVSLHVSQIVEAKQEDFTSDSEMQIIDLSSVEHSNIDNQSSRMNPKLDPNVEETGSGEVGVKSGRYVESQSTSDKFEDIASSSQQEDLPKSDGSSNLVEQKATGDTQVQSVGKLESLVTDETILTDDKCTNEPVTDEDVSQITVKLPKIKITEFLEQQASGSLSSRQDSGSVASSSGLTVSKKTSTKTKIDNEIGPSSRSKENVSTKKKQISEISDEEFSEGSDGLIADLTELKQRRKAKSQDNTASQAEGSSHSESSQLVAGNTGDDPEESACASALDVTYNITEDVPDNQVPSTSKQATRSSSHHSSSDSSEPFYQFRRNEPILKESQSSSINIDEFDFDGPMPANCTLEKLLMETQSYLKVEQRLIDKEITFTSTSSSSSSDTSPE
ncbi:hypothetical protein C0J52_24142 [Blattella germanica]|nr:hypothetical protein C0J52_24142 [Blattella germanica]